VFLSLFVPLFVFEIKSVSIYLDIFFPRYAFSQEHPVNHTPIQLIALDLDGTVVNEELEISPRVINTLQTVLKQTPVKVVIATGRMYSSSLPFADEIGLSGPIVAYQGALIREHGTSKNILEHTTIPPELAARALDLLLKNDYHVNLYHSGPDGDCLYTNDIDTYSRYYSKITGVRPTVLNDLREALDKDPTKFLIIDDHRIDQLLEDLNKEFDGALNVCKSRHNFCEIIHQDASKWNALMTLAKQWGIPPEAIMAIGDHGNDHSMVSQAGIGVAMGNGSDELKSVAKFVTKTIDEDGVAFAVEKFVLQPAGIG
jgi:Cof subfamily protein (haloacid dehalogenase superfamily)